MERLQTMLKVLFLVLCVELGRSEYLQCKQGNEVRDCPAMATHRCPVDFQSVCTPSKTKTCSGKKNLCFKVSPADTWEKTISACRDPLDLQGDGGSEAIVTFSDWMKLVEETQQGLNLSGDSSFWIPARRNMEGGPIYEAFGVRTDSIKEIDLIGQSKKIGLSLDHRRCLLYDKNSKTVVSATCDKRHPSVCFYRHPTKPDVTISQCLECGCINTTLLSVDKPQQYFCPPGWLSHRLIPGRRRCFKVFGSEIGITWPQAEQHCRQEKGQLATLERYDLYSVIVENLTQEWSQPVWLGLVKKNLPVGPVVCWVGPDGTCKYDPTFAPFYPCVSNDTDIYGAVTSSGLLKLESASVKLFGYLCETEVEPKPKYRLQAEVTKDLVGKLEREEKNHGVVFRVYLVNPKYTPNVSSCDAGVFPGKPVSRDCTEIPKVTCYQNGFIIPNQTKTGLKLEYQLVRPSIKPTAKFSCDYWFDPAKRVISSDVVLHGFETSYALRLKVQGSWNFSTFEGQLIQSSFTKAVEQRIDNAFRNHYRGTPPFNVTFFNVIKEDGLHINLLIYQSVDRFPVILAGCRERTESSTMYCFLEKVFSPGYEFAVVTNALPSDTKKPTDLKVYVEYLRPSFSCPQISERIPARETDLIGMHLVFGETRIHQYAIEQDSCLNEEKGLYQDVMYRKQCGGSEEYGAIWSPTEEIPREVKCFRGDDDLMTSLKEIAYELENTGECNIKNITEMVQDRKLTIDHIQVLTTILQKITIVPEPDLEKAFQLLAELKKTDVSLVEECQRLFDFSRICLEFTSKLTDSIRQTEKAEFNFVSSTFAHSTVLSTLNSPKVGLSVEVTQGSITEATVETDYKVPTTCDGVIFLPEELHRNDAISFTAYPDTTSFSGAAGPVPVYSYDLENSGGYVSLQSAVAANLVLEATVLSQTVVNLAEPVKFVTKRNPCFEGNVICAYWNPNINSLGGWATDGCTYNSTYTDEVDTYDICLCSHLTAFTKLIPSLNMSDRNAKALDWISSIGSILSMFALLLVLLTFAVYKPWRKLTGVKILVNLSFALFFALLLLQTAYHGQKECPKTVPFQCRIIIPFLHYFLIATFMWMLIEAYHQYEKYIYILPSYIPRFIQKAMIISWVSPVIPVIVGLAHEYETPYTYFAPGEVCWMSRNVFLYIVFSPWLIIMTANVIVYILFLKNAIFYTSNLRSTSRTLTASKIRASLFLFTILGLSWTFGLMTLFDPSLIFAYLFSIFSSFQGVCLLAFTVANDRDALIFWAKKFGLSAKQFERLSQRFSRTTRATQMVSGNSTVKLTKGLAKESTQSTEISDVVAIYSQSAIQ